MYCIVLYGKYLIVRKMLKPLQQLFEINACMFRSIVHLVLGG